MSEIKAEEKKVESVKLEPDEREAAMEKLKSLADKSIVAPDETKDGIKVANPTKVASPVNPTGSKDKAASKKSTGVLKVAKGTTGMSGDRVALVRAAMANYNDGRPPG